MDEYAVNKLLCQIFTSGELSAKESCSIIKESASRKFDMKEEVLPVDAFASTFLYILYLL